MMWLAWWFFAGVGEARAGCSATTAAELDALSTVAIGAFGDSAAFSAAAESVATRAPCLVTVISPAAAARLEYVLGLRAYLARDPENSVLYFAGARAADPELQPPGSLPATHPLRADFVALSLSNPKMASIVPSRGRVLVNGVEGDVPRGWPAVVQWEAPGQAVQTWLLVPADPLPPIPTQPLVPVALAPAHSIPTTQPAEPVKVHHSKAAPVALTSVGAIALGVGIGLYAEGQVNYRQDAYREMADGNQAAADAFYATRIRPYFDVGVALMAVGAVGAAGGGTWFVLTTGGGGAMIGGQWAW